MMMLVCSSYIYRRKMSIELSSEDKNTDRNSTRKKKQVDVVDDTTNIDSAPPLLPTGPEVNTDVTTTSNSVRPFPSSSRYHHIHHPGTTDATNIPVIHSQCFYSSPQHHHYTSTNNDNAVATTYNNSATNVHPYGQYLSSYSRNSNRTPIRDFNPYHHDKRRYRSFSRNQTRYRNYRERSSFYKRPSYSNNSYPYSRR